MNEHPSSGPIAVPRPRQGESTPIASTPTVQRAKGLLMFRYGVPSFQALAFLLILARTQGLDLLTAAERLIDGVELQEARPGDGSSR